MPRSLIALGYSKSFDDLGKPLALTSIRFDRRNIARLDRRLLQASFGCGCQLTSPSIEIIDPLQFDDSNTPNPTFPFVTVAASSDV